MTAAGPATELTAVAPIMLARWRLLLQDAQMPSSSAGARRFARAILWPISLLAIAALLWTGAWFYAARFATGRIAAWIEREKGHGRVWTCPEQSIGGFPTSRTHYRKLNEYIREGLPKGVSRWMFRTLMCAGTSCEVNLPKAVFTPIPLRFLMTTCGKR